MAESRDESGGSKSSINLVSEASAGRAPAIERMPRPSVRQKIVMRDGLALDTWVWLPFDREGPFPAILMRTPYQESLMGWKRLGTDRYRDAGYAVVIQLIRGIGTSEGNFSFNSPLDGPDGYDTIEWIAAQPWSTGAVGMDGSSYGGMTQLTTAATQPPHLKCIVPAVVSADFFNDTPRFGGAVSRQHTLGWTQFTWYDSLSHLTPGLWGTPAFLAAPGAWQRLLSRPAIDAAEGVLFEDRLQHYKDVMTHSVFDEFFAARTLGPEDYARITVPVMVVTGTFDGSNGSQHIWRQLEANAPADVERLLLIGPWDHGQSYVGGGRSMGPWQFGPAADFDLIAARTAFFDKHLKGIGDGPDLPGRVTLFVQGQNRWIGEAQYPLPQTAATPMWLHSDGLANLRGHGSLTFVPPEGDEVPDCGQADPSLPFVPVGASLDPDLAFDLREFERQEDVLTYTSAPLEEPLLLIGQFEIELHVAADTPDCDVVCYLALVPEGGHATALSMGLLRLRYREGWDREVLLTPGEPVVATIQMKHVACEIPAGSRLRLMIGSDFFPLIDPNPNTGEPIATAKTVQISTKTIFHDAARPSHVRLPVVTAPLKTWTRQ